MDSQGKFILEQTARHLHAIGSANDAEDHGYIEEARRMRSIACTGLAELLEYYPPLGDLLPSLGTELDSGRILIISWSSLLDQLETHLANSSRLTQGKQDKLR